MDGQGGPILDQEARIPSCRGYHFSSGISPAGWSRKDGWSRRSHLGSGSTDTILPGISLFVGDIPGRMVKERWMVKEVPSWIRKHGYHLAGDITFRRGYPRQDGQGKMDGQGGPILDQEARIPSCRGYHFSSGISPAGWSRKDGWSRRSHLGSGSTDTILP